MRGFRAMEVDVLDPSKFRECVSPRLVFEVTLYTNVPLVLDYRPIVEPAVGRLSAASGRAYIAKNRPHGSPHASSKSRIVPVLSPKRLVSTPKRWSMLR